VHLLLPLAAGMLLVSGLLLIQRCAAHGVTPWTTTFLANQWAALLFSALWFFGGSGQPLALFYQPLIIASLFMLGLGLTFTAVEVGDVSIATPVLGIKVIFVALLSIAINDTILPESLWLAAILATIGIGCIQWTGGGQHRRILLTISLAICASISFATFDILVQRWSPAWGAGRFLPYVYWTVGAVSWFWAPKVQWKKILAPEVRTQLLLGTMLVGGQAICIVLALAIYGDAVRVNIVYALRGLWGVLFAWTAAKIWGAGNKRATNRQMLIRLTGALILTAAVILALLAN